MTDCWTGFCCCKSVHNAYVCTLICAMHQAMLNEQLLVYAVSVPFCTFMLQIQQQHTPIWTQAGILMIERSGRVSTTGFACVLYHWSNNQTGGIHSSQPGDASSILRNCSSC